MKKENDIPEKILKEAWLAGTKAVRKHSGMTTEEGLPSISPGYIKGMRAAAQVILKWNNEKTK